MNPKRLHRRWLDSLQVQTDCIRKLLRRRGPLSATEVHSLRVALRRARLLAGLGRPLLGKAGVHTFRRSAHALLILLAPVRDSDVALDWLREIKASTALVAKLQLHRDRLWRATKRRMQMSATKFVVEPKKKPEVKKLARRVTNLLNTTRERCQKTVQSEAEIPTPELHALRRLVRRWRYLRELELNSRGIRRDPRLRSLIEVQECLGELQNAEVILEQLQKLGRTVELGRLRSGLKADHNHHRRAALRQIKFLPVPAPETEIA